jgi:hypothetical protein
MFGGMRSCAVVWLGGAIAAALWRGSAGGAEVPVLPPAHPSHLAQLFELPPTLPGSARASSPAAVFLSAVREAAPAPVPPTLEIEVLDPSADPLGNPAVIVRDDGCGQSVVDIPPVVLVHRYYYTGDRSFQGPMLPGGPSIVVVNDPRNGQRCYIPLQMLPGAPRVHYSGRKIEYDYGRNGISISFGLWGKPKVVYRNSVPATRRAKNAIVGAEKEAGWLVEQSGLPDLAKTGAAGTKNVLVNTRNAVEDLGQGLLAPAIGLVNSTPLGSIFRGNPEDQAQRRRDAEVRRAAQENAKAAFSLPTLR